jgi:GT2 family glycosyltransferase
MIEIVSATRLSVNEFRQHSALGQSLARLAFDDRIRVSLAPGNRSGLPQVFNARLLAPQSSEILVFIHDDVWIDDFFFADRIIEALKAYDVVGVAGNRRRIPGQPGWAFVDANLTLDDLANLSGAIAHGERPFGAVSYFGPAPADCELLDGVFLAVRKSAVLEHGVSFDPRFDFHLYDMDFCRSARAKGLRLGTWPLCLTHQSSGAFGSEHWQATCRVYLEKWGS